MVDRQLVRVIDKVVEAGQRDVLRTILREQRDAAAQADGDDVVVIARIRAALTNLGEGERWCPHIQGLGIVCRNPRPRVVGCLRRLKIMQGVRVIISVCSCRRQVGLVLVNGGPGISIQQGEPRFSMPRGGSHRVAAREQGS